MRTLSDIPYRTIRYTPLHPGPEETEEALQYDKRRYKLRNRIEIMFGGLKDWRRGATRYDRCPQTFFSVSALAATVYSGFETQ